MQRKTVEFPETTISSKPAKKRSLVNSNKTQSEPVTSLRRYLLYYRPRNNGNKSEDDAGSLVVMFFGALIVIFYAWLRLRMGCSRESLDSMRRKNRHWVGEELPTVADPGAQAGDYKSFETATWELPPGMWEGYYKQYRSKRSLPAFQLESSPMQNSSDNHVGSSSLSRLEQLTGSGKDDAGLYKLFGIWNPTTGRLSLTKAYVRRTGFWIAVEYKGTMILSSSSSQSQKPYHEEQRKHSAHLRITGTWSQPAYQYTETGTFAFWPVDRATATTSSCPRPVLVADALQDDSGKSAPLMSKDERNQACLELT